MNRAERRRAAKAVAKGEITISRPQPKIIPTEIRAANGKRYTDVEKYLNDMEMDVAKQVSDIASEKLYESEIYIAVANIITMLYAVDMVVGDLKTVQRSYQRIIGKINEASELIDQMGIREAYERFSEKYGVALNFDDCDLNWVYDNGEDFYRRFRLNVGN